MYGDEDTNHLDTRVECCPTPETALRSSPSHHKWSPTPRWLAAHIRDHIRSGTASSRGTVQHSWLCGRSSGSEETRTTSLKDK